MRLLLFSLLSLSIALTSCGSNADSITNLPEKTEGEAEFNLETFEFEDLSPEMQEQISEVGCDYSFKKDGKPFMINGFVKINGIFERLQEVQMNDERTIIFMNKNWEIQINADYIDENDDRRVIVGSGQLKSRINGKTKDFKAFGTCYFYGC